MLARRRRAPGRGRSFDRRARRRPPARAASPAPVAPAVDATNRLAVTLLPRLGGGGDTVFSPYSIATALAMIDQGAAASTATQIGRVLGSGNATALAASERRLSSALAASVRDGSPGTSAGELARLQIANGLWVGSQLSVEQPFGAALGQDFGATPQTLDFGGSPDAARKAINAWVAQHTAQRIKGLMPPGTITAQTRLVLANAIYLNAHWSNPFVKGSTAPGPFEVAGGAMVTVRFMTEPVTQFAYGRGAGYRAIDLPYLDSTLSMLVVIPATGTLPGFEGGLNLGALSRISRGLATARVALRMPRFKLSLHAELNDVLSALGMPLAFSDAADFSGITHSVALKIQAVEQGATLTADEQGTVAAAATGISTEPTALPSGPIVRLTLDHPFLFFIRDDV
ncbi:MAG TPA: serpin family protein, partial [Solirubrobacteraceae bacterium]|nr:serpin family protein [Solirubrobacteraceae bacterium]